jgi:hypothetical protein
MGRNVDNNAMNENYYLLESDLMVKHLDFYCESEEFNSLHLQPIWICLISLFNLSLVMLLNLKPSLIEGCLSKPCDVIFLKFGICHMSTF